jgi:DNA-binding LacI/PurR family transcriptional regulator
MSNVKTTKGRVSDNEGSRIYEVAERAGVSIVTVSRVFNNYPHVSDQMRKRVFSAARDVGYAPRLVSKRPVIAVILGHLDHLSAGDYKTRLILHMVRAAAKQEYLVEFIPYDSIFLATQHHVDGIIEVGLTRDEMNSARNLPNVPTVLTNKDRLRDEWCAVCSDHYQEAQLATRHLIDKGHRRIALVLDEFDGWGPEQRRAGYETTLASEAESADPLVLSAAEQSPEAIATAMRDAGCTAGVLLTDNAGMAIFDAVVNELKMRVPDDFSVVAMENEAVSRFIAPRLTTIEQPLAEIAEGAVEYIIDRIQGETHPAPKIYRSRLVERDSVTAPPQNG